MIYENSMLVHHTIRNNLNIKYVFNSYSCTKLTASMVVNKITEYKIIKAVEISEFVQDN